MKHYNKSEIMRRAWEINRTLFFYQKTLIVTRLLICKIKRIKIAV